MKRITVSVTVDDSYYVGSDKLRWLKDDMIVAAMERVSSAALNVVAIEAKVGTTRRPK